MVQLRRGASAFMPNLWPESIAVSADPSTNDQKIEERSKSGALPCFSPDKNQRFQ
jgi:hypothetical protein